MSKKATLSTHVLDTAGGTPAEGVRIEIFHDQGGDWAKLGEATTNADGRVVDLVPAEGLSAGKYQLVFSVQDYFAGRDCFYDQVPVIFKVAENAGHYHVPLLISPFGYSTYRGS